VTVEITEYRNGCFKSDLVHYAQLSTDYPYRIITSVIDKNLLEDIKQQISAQLGYYHIGRCPFHVINMFTYFFESEDDATLMQLVIGGAYSMEIYKDENK
jgi:hypothetical protein